MAARSIPGNTAVHGGEGGSFDSSHIPKTLPIIGVRIAVQDLTPHATVWYPHAVVLAHYRREITHNQHSGRVGMPLSYKAQNAAGGIITVHPGKTCWIAIAFMQRWRGGIQTIQVLYPALQASVCRVGEQMPIETAIVVPLPPLAKLAPHEEQFLARLGVHIAQQEPQIGKLIPIAAGHFIEQ